MPESRSLSELTRQIAPPTKNGHAPPPTESRKSYQSVNPVRVRAGINQVGGSERDDEEPGVPVAGGWWGEADPREAREPREEGGAGKGARRAGRPDRPGPARGEDARPRDPPSGSARVAARRRHRAGGTRGGAGWCGGEEGGGPPCSLPPPSRPARATPGTADARPRRPSVHPPQSGAGDAGRRGRGDRPAAGQDRGPVPRSGERTGAGAPPRPARDGGGGGGGDTGDGSGPRRAREARHTRARGPGEQQTARGPRRTDGRRGAPTGCGHAGPTPRNRRRGGGPAAPPATKDWRPHPRGARGHRHRHPRSRSRPGENTLPPHTGGPPPHGPHARGAPPPRPPRSGLSEGTAPLRPGTPPARQGPGDDTHVKARRGRLGPGQGTGTRAVARAGRGEARRGRRRRGGAGEHARRGPRDRDAGAVRGPEEKDRATRPGPQEHQRGIPPPPAREGGPATPGAPAGPGHPRSVARDPAPPPGSVFRLSLNPEARPPGDDALERGGPDRDRTPPPAAAQGARAGLTPRGPAARTRPPTCRTPGGAQRDPPPTRRGEARAAGPRNLVPATCPQRCPINTRPRALLGGGGGVSSGRPGGGEGRVVAKAGARTPREGEPAEDALPASSTRVGVPVRPSLRTGIWLRRAKGTQKTEPSARRFPRDERAPTRERARGPDRPRRGTQDGPSRSPPPDRDAGSRRGVSQSRVRRPRPTRARWRVERALPGHPREQGPVHPRLRTRQDLDREKARVPRDASGDRTPRGDRTRASPGPPSGPHLRSATRKTPRAERTRGPGPRRALRRPPSHRPGRSPPPERGRRRSKRS
ncbi:hypothetical protein AB1E19_004659 [Capra hircus]